MSDFYKGKVVAVAGGSGFIGTHYIEHLLELGALVRTHTHVRPLQRTEWYSDHRVTVIQGIDLTTQAGCNTLVDGVDYLVHAGGRICHPASVPTDIQVSIQNIQVTGQLLDACVKSNVKGFLDLNSSTGYPDIRRPLEEDEFWTGEPHSKYYGYGWMRRYREKLMEHVSRFSDMKIALARGTAIYGPNDNFDLKTCHVVPALIKRVLSDENPFEVWGSPDVVRDFLYVKDVVRAGLLVLEKGVSMKPYNVGSGEAVTVGDIVDAILKATGKTPEVFYDASKPTTIPFRMVSTERLESELGFQKEYSFEQGIAETVKWYIENND
jgi:GDP-L-fucose synthase